MKLSDLKGKKVLLVGMGIEGQATLQYLRHHISDIDVTAVDQTDGADYLAHQSLFDLAIVSPSVKKELIRIPYTTATNIFFANTRGMTIGVTGTKGKSTTASLIFSILKAAGKRTHLVGNIGNPVLLELLKERGAQDIYVCELSSYQLEDISYSPHIAVMVSFFPEHMDHHGSVDRYWEAKKRIAKFLKPEDFLVFNPAFRKLSDLAKDTVAHAVPYVDTLPCGEKEVPLLGKHNRDNVRAAATVAQILEIPRETLANAIRSFHPLPHRLEYIGTYKDIRFYDDAISTTPESAIAAIEALETVGTIFLGGQDRGYDFRELVSFIDRSPIKNIVFFPDSGEKIEMVLKEKSRKHYRTLRTKDMQEAVQFAFDTTPPGSICLLSTASPSYSVWKNFEEKGALFATYVKALGQ